MMHRFYTITSSILMLFILPIIFGIDSQGKEDDAFNLVGNWYQVIDNERRQVHPFMKISINKKGSMNMEVDTDSNHRYTISQEYSGDGRKLENAQIICTQEYCNIINEHKVIVMELKIIETNMFNMIRLINNNLKSPTTEMTDEEYRVDDQIWAGVGQNFLRLSKKDLKMHIDKKFYRLIDLGLI